MDALETKLLECVTSNRWNAHILETFQRLQLTDWWLTAGCVAQSVWNVDHSRPPEEGILDYDIFYFDADTSWEAEDAIIARTAALFADSPVEVQVRNQARVPLWYEQKFGIVYPPVACAADGIDRFPCRTMSVGLRQDGDAIIVHAPYGLVDVLAGRLTPNTLLWLPDVYAAKAERWMRQWPKLTLQPWPDKD